MLPIALRSDWQDVAARIRSPAIVYDVNALASVVDALRDDLAVIERAQLAFAVKANRSPGVLGVLAELGLGADVASRAELRAAQAADLRPIYATSPAFSTANLREAHKAGVLPDLDGFSQLRAWGAAAPSQRSVGLRVEAPVPRVERTCDLASPWSRFGVDIADPRLHELLAQLDLQVVQLHIHAGELADASTVTALGAVLEEAAQLFPAVTLLNIGGGLAALYADRRRAQTGWMALADAVRRIAAALGRAPCVVVEPGMLISAMAGVLVTEVRAVERRRDEGRIIVTVDSSAWALLPWSVPRLLASVPERPGPRVTVGIAGSSCYERDWLVEETKMPLPRPGDRLVVSAAGAYVTSMARSIHGYETPEEWLLDHTRLEPARARHE